MPRGRKRCNRCAALHRSFFCDACEEEIAESLSTRKRSPCVGRRDTARPTPPPSSPNDLIGPAGTACASSCCSSPGPASGQWGCLECGAWTNDSESECDECLEPRGETAVEPEVASTDGTTPSAVPLAKKKSQLTRSGRNTKMTSFYGYGDESFAVKATGGRQGTDPNSFTAAARQVLAEIGADKEVVDGIAALILRLQADVGEERSARVKAEHEAFALKQQLRQVAAKQSGKAVAVRGSIDTTTGEGYGLAPSESRLQRHHAAAVVELIVSKAPDDLLRQHQLARYVLAKLSGEKAVTSAEEKRLEQAKEDVLLSINKFNSELRQKNPGRYSNNARTALQGAAASVVTTGISSLRSRAIVTGFNRHQLSLARKKWAAYLDGDEDYLVELRGALRDDKIPEAWVIWATEEIWIKLTRASEKKKEAMRNPRDRSDKELYPWRFLEMRRANQQ